MVTEHRFIKKESTLYTGNPVWFLWVPILAGAAGEFSSPELALPQWHVKDPGHSGNELTRNSSGNTQPQSSQLAELPWTDLGLKSSNSVRELISTLLTLKKKFKAQAGNEWSNSLPKILASERKKATTTKENTNYSCNLLHHRWWWSELIFLQGTDTRGAFQRRT